MSDSPRRTGGGWRLLARALVVAGAAAAGGSVGWVAHADADPAPDLGIPGLGGDSAERADPAEHAEPAEPGPLPHVVSSVAGTARELTAPPSESDGPERPGEFALHDLAPTRLVGHVARAEPVVTVVRGADSALRPVLGRTAPDPEHRPALEHVAEPIAGGLHQLTSPLRTPELRPEPPAARPPVADPAAPAPEPVAAPADPALSAHSRPAPATRLAPNALTDTAPSPRADPAGAPDRVPPKPPAHPAALPAPAPAHGSATSTDGLPGGVGLHCDPPSAAPANTALRAAELDAARALRGTCAPAPGTTPD